MSKGVVLLAIVTLVLTLAFFLLVRPLVTALPPGSAAPPAASPADATTEVPRR
jgi:hypothetical protein